MAPKKHSRPRLRSWLWLTLGLLACSPGDQTRAEHNLLLISVDTLRADRLGCYGYPRGTSPNLDQLAAEGVRFDQATAPSPWTLPSHASMFSGLSPKRHGASGLKSRMRDSATTLAELLLESGYQTHAIVSSTILQGGGLERGFESLAMVDTGGPHPSAVTQACIDKLQTLDPEAPFFLLAHYIDPHTDYGSLEPFRSRFLEPYEGKANGNGAQLYRAISGDLELSEEDVRHLSNLYDGGIAQVDAEIEKLLAHLRQAGLWESTLIVLTSDHGEEFLDHGGLMHGLNHHEEMIRVPLLMRGPGLPVGMVSRTPVSLMDILPTCLRALGLTPPANLEGFALQPLWEEPEAQLAKRNFYYEADWDAPLPGRRNLSRGYDRALRMGDYKLHLNLKSGAMSLYDLANDPRELQDLSEAEPEVLLALSRELRRYLDEDPDAPGTEDEEPLTEQELEDLIRLGYAGEEEDEEQ